MRSHPSNALLPAMLALLVSLPSCGGGSGGGGGGSATGSNRARFTYMLDLQGAPATLVLDAEVVGNTGVTWGPGATPDITGVVGAGTYTVFTSGTVTSANANYVFTGENAFADFTETSTFDRFRVQWIEVPNGLTMVVNPFGPGPVAYDCVLVRAVVL